MLRLPDTGETFGYTNTFGEDNDFTINPPFFIVNKDGTVLDTVTGLMWQKTDGGEMTVEAARTYVASLSLGGFTDWRLPSAIEAYSILNLQRVNPALDTAVFTYSAAEYWWCIQTQLNDASKVWVINSGGGIGSHPKAETMSAGGVKRFHVRAVRDRTTPPTIANHFTDNNKGIVADPTTTDNLTNLTWQQLVTTDSLTWEEALKYASATKTSGSTDWRLPNIKELQSIVDVALFNPSVSTTFFSTINSDAKLKKFWSSTTLPNLTDKAWYLEISSGLTTYETKTTKLKVMLVRGNLNLKTATTNILDTAAKPIVSPNPFTEHFFLKEKTGNENFELFNVIGQIIFSGCNVEQQNFSFLPSGIYFLKVFDASNAVIKLFKQ